MFYLGLFLSPVFYFHYIVTRNLKPILLFFELNFKSCFLTSLTMRLYLQVVQKVMTQLDHSVLLDLIHINVDMPLFFSA